MINNKILGTFLILGLILSCENQNDRPINVMAYYVPSNTINVKNLPFDKLSHIIFSFTEVIDHQMQFPQEEIGESLEKLTEATKNYTDLKIMVACGGWTGSGGFYL